MSPEQGQLSSQLKFRTPKERVYAFSKHHETGFKMSKWRILAGIALVVGLIGIVFVSLLYGITGGDIPFDHGVMIDAGSSHTELLLYEWHGSKYKGTGMVTQKETCDVADGISSFKVPEEAGASLLPCLAKLSNKIPEEKRSDTPVYLGATAGMRLLNISNHYLNLATFTALRCAIPQSGLKREEVGIITGQDEGIFAWITTNFLLGTVQRKEHPTLGALDMGGASTQISFEVAEEHSKLKHVRTMRLYGETYHVFSITYLCYGAAEIDRRYHAQLITDVDNHGPINSPCMNKGNNYEMDARYLLNAPCTETEALKKEFFLNPGKLNATYKFAGTGDNALCRAAMAVVFDPEDCKSKYQECFEPIGPIKMSKEFIALSSYAYTTQFLKPEKSFESYQEKVQTHCLKDWKELSAMDFPKPVKKTLPRFCEQGHAIERILTYGYGFNDTTWNNIQFATKVNGTGVGWALGYMINATNAIPEELPSSPTISTALFAVLLIVFVIILALGLFFCIRERKTKRMATVP